MIDDKSIKIEIPLNVAIEMSKMTETYAPLTKAVAQACFTALYENKIVSED